MTGSRQLYGIFAALVIAAMPAGAQTERSGGGQSQKIMQQYQQLAAEKTALQTQLVQLKTDLDTATASLAAMKKERDALALKARADSSGAEQQLTARAAAEKTLEQYRQRSEERLRDAANSLRESEATRARLTRDLDERNHAYDQCAANNLQLHDLAVDVLDRYDHVGQLTKAGNALPVTGLSRNRIDNLVLEYRERADQLRTPKPAP